MSTMASRLRFVLSASSKLVRCQSRFQSAQHSTFLGSRHQILGKQISNAVSPYLRNFAPTLTAVKTVPSFPAQHRCLQTEVDKELSKFLEKEISYEESATDKPQMKTRRVEGFEVTTNDADVTLTRKAGNETVVVKFSINASVDSDGPLPEGEAPEMVSRPPFTVEVTKGDGRTLSLQCMFASPEEVDPQGGPQDAEAIVDNFEIQEVALYSGEWKDTIYSVSADIMDGNLYDLLVDMLDERGINEEFINQMVDYSTSYEQSRYLDFLKNLKSFVEK